MLKSFKLIYIYNLKNYIKKKKNYNKLFYTILKNYYNVYGENDYSWDVANSKDIINFYVSKQKNKIDLTTIFNQKWFFFKI
jgi:hypothetical protein